MEINDLPRELKAKIIQGKDLTGNLNFHRWTKFFAIFDRTSKRPDIRVLDVKFAEKYEFSYFFCVSK